MIKLVTLFLIFSLASGGAFLFQNNEQVSQQPKKEISIKAISGLQYDVVRFTIKPGETVSLTLINTDEMTHNMIITLPNQREEIVVLAGKLSAQGPEKNYIPESEKILAAIPLLGPGEKKTIEFTAPEKEGVYPYVCTYPGHGAVMYGAMYVTNNALPPLSADLNVPPVRRANPGNEAPEEPAHPWPARLPAMYRTFMPDCGPAGIAVGMQGDVSYCWDAGQCRLRYAWKGGFVDMKRNWSGKGKELADIVGVVFYRDSTEFPIRIGDKNHIPKPEFHGYSMENRYPTFKYSLDDVVVTERIEPIPEQAGFRRTFTFEHVTQPLWFVWKEDKSIDLVVDRGNWAGNYLKLSPEEAREFTITITEKTRKPL